MKYIISDTRELFSDMWTDSLLGKIMVCFIGLLVVSIPLAIYASVIEEREWQSFKIEYECKVVARVKGHVNTGVGYGVTGSGHAGTIVTTSTTPDKTSWLCTDGITYTR